MNKYLEVIGILFIMFSIIRCNNLDYTESFYSHNIKDSKEKNTFICKYKINNVNFRESKEFNFNEIWLEKKWRSYLDKWGNEKIEIFDSTAQLMINFTKDHNFTKDIYWEKFVLQDEKGNKMGSLGNILFLDIDSLPHNNTFLKLYAIKVANKYEPNSDTLKIGYFLLQKR